ncbi:uncharacterized protein LOC128127043 [Lactuca sativa]|uniref:uncharacterized protein LOC128127043 n=1 Tax=Lactuca sativa TaxID=4236 RepID=UPI0022B05FE7|nr:uncharacterized protein LOC128127043 [Lactuca sativa]
MPRSFRTGTPVPVDFEIEKYAKQRRKQARLLKKQQQSGASSSNPPTTSSPTSKSITPPSSPTHTVADNHGGNQNPPHPPPEQTIRQWVTQDVTQQPLCVNYPAAINFELKSGLIHLLPLFCGLENEDPHKFLKEFHVVCVGMKPHEVAEDQIKLSTFPFALQDSAKEWLYDLPSGSVTTWNELARMFLDKYFPEIRASALRRETIGINQQKREALHTYWERFKKLCSRCPQHGITEYQLLQYFCEGMSSWDRRLLNASSGGSIADKTPTEIRVLIKNMAEESKHTVQEEEWYSDAPRGVKEISTPKIESQLSELTKVVMMLAKDKGVQPPTVRPCGICTQVGHPTDMCPQLQEEDYEEAKAMKGFLGSSQRVYEQPRGDQRWNNNQGWGGNQQGNYQPSQPHQYQQRLPFPPQNFQPRQPQHPPQQFIKYVFRGHSEKFDNYKLESQGKLSAQTEANPRHNVCAITLRGGKSYDGPKLSVDQKEEEIVVEEATKEEKEEERTIEKKPFITESKATPAPFPERLKSTKKEREENEIMQMFKRVQINIPLLEVIKQVPRYARFLKDLCVSKKKLKGNQVVTVGEHVSVVLQKRMPPK